MPDEVFQRLLDWGEEIGGDAEVIVVDFRHNGCIQAARIGVKNASSLGALVAQLIAMAFNVMRASDAESAVEAAAIPYAFVRSKFFERSGNVTATRLSGPQTVATVITDDGKAESCADPMSNHQLVTMLSRITKRPVVYVDVPENIARQSMRQLGMPVSLIEGLLQLPVRTRSRNAATQQARS